MEIEKKNIKEIQAVDRIKDTLINLDEMYKGHVIPEQIYHNIKNSFEFCLKAYKFLRYRYIFTGVISSGKTSLINALLGKFLLQTSIMQCTQWPIIIRHHDCDIPSLYSSKINKDFEFEYEEDILIAQGMDQVTENIVKINTNKSLIQSFDNNLQNIENNRKIKRNDEYYSKETSYELNDIEFSKFVFILKIKVNFASFLSDDNKYRFEIWDLPGMNDKNDKFNKLLVKMLLAKEEKLRDNLSLFHIQRLFFVYISDFACLNQTQVVNLWESFEGMRIYCEKILFIVNKIDQFNFSNILLFFKKDIPQELVSFVKKQYIEYKDLSINDEEIEINNISDLEKLYNSLTNTYKAKVISLCKFILIKSIKNLYGREKKLTTANQFNIFSNNQEMDELNNSEFFEVSTISSLQSLLEDYMKKGNLDDTFWRIQHYLFSNNGELQTIFPDFSFYKFYLQSVIKEGRKNYDFLIEFQGLEKKLAIFIEESNVINKIILSYNDIVKSSVIGTNKCNGLMSSSFIQNTDSRKVLLTDSNIGKLDKVDNRLFGSLVDDKNIYSLKMRMNLDTPDIIDISKYDVDLDYSIKELKNLLDLFFNDLQGNVNELVYSIKNQIENVFMEKQNKINEYLNSILLYNAEKFDNVGKFYDEITKEIYQIKEFTNKKFLKNKNDLIENLEMDIENLCVNSFIIKFYIKEIDQIMDFELLRFQDNFVNSDINFFTSLGVGLGAGMISFFVANAFRTFGTAAIGEVSGSAISGSAFGPVGICIGVFVGAIAFTGTIYYYNNKNKLELMDKEKELWKKIMAFKDDIFVIVDQFKKNIEKSIETKKLKINCLMKFLSTVFNNK